MGIATPESFTKSTPAYFQDEKGNYGYSFCEGNDGQDLYDNVQASVDAARAEGADYVVAVAHLGVEEISEPWRSTDVDLTTLNPETEERMVRSQETNLGDLCADAYRWALNADIGLVNGGGIRADIAAGDITYGQIINVHPYSNQATS